MDDPSKATNVEKPDEVSLEFDENDLSSVDISDTTLEAADKETSHAKKGAKKTAKKLRTPEEKKRAFRKKILMAVMAVVVVVGALLAIPTTRWPMLNFIGFRSTLVVTVQEKGGSKPVAHAAVKLQSGALATTDSFGRASFSKVRLGPQKLTVQKAGYGDITQTITSSFGTTKPKVALKVIGIQLNFDLKNWLSNQPVAGATLKYEKSSAQSDATGRASLVIPPTDQTQIEVGIVAPGYLTKTVKTDIEVESREVSLIAAQKNYFLSKRDGRFDLFSSNLDGSDQRKLIEATGKEDENLLQLSVNRNNKQAILVATRDGRIQNGRLIAGVYSLDLEKASLKKIDEGSDIQLLDWADTTMLYTKSDPGLNYDDPAFSRLMSFNTTNSRLAELAQTNYFAAALVAQNKVFFMPSDPYRSIDNAQLTSIDVGSGAKKSYLGGKLINYATRPSYGTLELQDTSGANFELQISTGTTKSVDRRPNTALSFALSPNNQLAVWTDKRDGQGALLSRNLKTNEEKVVAKVGGLTNPVRFVSDDLVVVRIATSQETADYVVSLASGRLGKISDVSNIGSVRQYGL